MYCLVKIKYTLGEISDQVFVLALTSDQYEQLLENIPLISIPGIQYTGMIQEEISKKTYDQVSDFLNSAIYVDEILERLPTGSDESDSSDSEDEKLEYEFPPKQTPKEVPENHLEVFPLGDNKYHEIGQGLHLLISSDKSIFCDGGWDPVEFRIVPLTDSQKEFCDSRKITITDPEWECPEVVQE